MLNPVINTSPSSAQRSDPVANSTNSATDGSTADTFGTVLARQIGEKSAANAASKNTPASKATQNQAHDQSTDSATQDTAITPDAASLALAAFSTKDIKLTLAKSKTDDTSTKTTQDPTTPSPASMVVIGNPEIRVSTGVGSSIDSNTSAGSVLTSRIDLKPGVEFKSGVDPKTVVAPKTGFSPKVDASATIQASASDPKIATATADNIKPVQTAIDPANHGLAAPIAAIKSAAEAQAKLAADQIAPAIAPSAITAPALPATTHSIASPLGSNAWSSEFSQKISWLSNQQSQVAELHLNPPDLGPMHVVISVTDNQATALFTSPHSEVRNAIENALPKLRESLADNGIMLGNATVSDQTPRDSGAGNFTQQRAHNRMEISSAIEPAPISTPLIATSRHTGMLDTFA